MNAFHIVLWILAASFLTAQHRPTTADIRITTTDATGGALAGAYVTIVNDDNGLRRELKTDAGGVGTFPALPPGVYSVTAAATYFNPETRVVQLQLGTLREVVFALSVAGTTDHVTVTADAETAESHPDGIISRRRIDQLPINSRNFISFALTTPGIHDDRMPQQGASATSGLSFAGLRARSNNITVDGLDNNDAALGAVRATFSQEAVQEFQVLAGSYPAEYGKASGGVINIVTRSGGNRTAGEAFAYVRSHVLQARDHFEKFDPDGNVLDRPKAGFSQLQAGATLGGALQRDMMFYFAAFDHFDMRANNFVAIDDTKPVTLGSVSMGTPLRILENAGFSVQTGSVPYRARTSSLLLKTDHRFSPRHSLYLRLNLASILNENSEAWGGLVGRSRGAALRSEDRAAALSHTWIGGGGLVNELRTQAALRRQTVFSLDPACGGPCVGDDQGGPTVEVIGFAHLGRHRFTPQPRSSRRLQLVDTLSVHAGRHLLKTGFDASVIRNRDERLPLHFGGRYVFAAELPGSLAGLPYETINSIQAVALGMPAAYVQGYGNPGVSYTVADVSGFVQDDWRIRPALTLGLGVRYQKQFWPQPFPSDVNNLAPRLALAWNPRGTDKLTLQAAYGLFFDNQLTILPAVARVLDGDKGVRTLALQFPNPLVVAAWNAPGRRLPEADAGSFPSTRFAVDPRLRTPFAHHFTTGLTHRWSSDLTAHVSAVLVRGHAQLGTIDYNPILPDLGPGRRPADVNRMPGTSAPYLQFTSFGRTWYRGLNVSLRSRLNQRLETSATYTLSHAKDTSTDYQSAFLPQNNGRGRDPSNPEGLPLLFDSLAEKGFSIQDQRHRAVLSGSYQAPWNTMIVGLLNAGSGRPYSIIAGVDLNGDGNGGAFPSDRARRVPALESTSVPRNSGRLPPMVTLDLRLSRQYTFENGVRIRGMLEVFNVLNRTNYTEINNVFGSGAYPDRPLPGYGRYTQAGPMRQAQIAVKLLY